jgi:hypothetical protein
MKGLEHYLILIILRVNKYFLYNINVDENIIDPCKTFIHLGMDVGI